MLDGGAKGWHESQGYREQGKEKPRGRQDAGATKHGRRASRHVRTLAAVPPDGESADDDDERQQELAGDAEPSSFALASGDAAIFCWSLGRMEIRSSSEASQLMVLSARSRLPLKLMKELAAQSRNCRRRRSGPGNFPCRCCRCQPQRGVKGPFLFFGSLGSIAGQFRLLVAKLVSEESNSFWTRSLVAILDLDRTREGEAGAVPFMPFTMG